MEQMAEVSGEEQERLRAIRNEEFPDGKPQKPAKADKSSDEKESNESSDEKESRNEPTEKVEVNESSDEKEINEPTEEVKVDESEQNNPEMNMDLEDNASSEDEEENEDEEEEEEEEKEEGKQEKLDWMRENLTFDNTKTADFTAWVIFTEDEYGPNGIKKSKLVNTKTSKDKYNYKNNGADDGRWANFIEKNGLKKKDK